MVSQCVAAKMSANDSPAPSRAVTRGSEAAITDAKVAISTAKATAMPRSSVTLIPATV